MAELSHALFLFSISYLFKPPFMEWFLRKITAEKLTIFVAAQKRKYGNILAMTTRVKILDGEMKKETGRSKKLIFSYFIVNHIWTEMSQFFNSLSFED